MTVELHFSLQSANATDALHQFLTAIQHRLPKIVRTCYVVGSHAKGTAHAGSLLEVVLVIEPGVTLTDWVLARHAAAEVAACTRQRLWVELVSATDLEEEIDSELKFHSVCVYGIDQRDDLPVNH